MSPSPADPAARTPSDLSALVLRSATPADVLKIAFLIRQLAIYERLEDEMVGDPQDLSRHLFGERPYAEAILAEWEGESIGLALFFHNYSTFLMQPGLYLEDLFVMPQYRGRGVGKALLQHLAQIAIDRGCGRFEWSVLDWNTPAIEFYQSQGAEVLQEWRICRVTGQALTELAQTPTQTSTS
ncbi:MAG: GNAT family N-acetyltransferase [Prochlorothrix sp.]|nr:GNAT family N-acetyltransferase [Prochlorothrix sp.]